MLEETINLSLVTITSRPFDDMAVATLQRPSDVRHDDMDELLLHYDTVHDESVDDLLQRARAKMGRKQIERKERYEKFGKEAVEYKGKFYNAPDLKDYQEEYTGECAQFEMRFVAFHDQMASFCEWS